MQMKPGRPLLHVERKRFEQLLYCESEHGWETRSKCRKNWIDRMRERDKTKGILDYIKEVRSAWKGEQ